MQCLVYGGGGMKGGGAIKAVYVCRVVLPGVHTGLSSTKILSTLRFHRQWEVGESGTVVPLPRSTASALCIHRKPFPRP